MKQLKFLMVAVTLLIGISLTSCIGEGDPTVTNVTFGQITSIFPIVIKTPYGVEYTATNSLESDLYPGDYVYFQYSYNSDLVEQNATKIDATITIGEKITYKPAVNVSDKGEDFESVTILQVGNGPESNFKFLYYDKSKILFPVMFLMKDLSKESLNKHDFTLVYNEEDVKADDSEIVFYLRHKSSETEAKQRASAYKLFDINRALEQFKAKTGNKPTKVVVYTNETKDNTTDALDKKKDELTKYEVVYEFKD